MLSQNWWERYPERLNFELQALDAAGFEYEKDDDAFSSGIARLIVFADVGLPAPTKLVVTFPDFYPFFRFSIEAPEIELEHHQHPFGKNLCVLGRATELWRTGDTVAAFIKDRVPEVISAGMSQNFAEVEGREENQAEPYSDYYTYAPAMLSIDGAWDIRSSATYGTFRYGLVAAAGAVPWIRGVVLEVRDQDDEIIAEASPSIGTRFSGRILKGRWVRSERAIAINDPAEFFAHVAALDPEARRLKTDTVGEFGVSLRAAVFPEEVEWRTTGAHGWIFVARTISNASVKRSPSRSSNQPRNRNPTFYFARAGRAGVRDLKQRVPELNRLNTSAIAIFGIGCIGAPSALEFARAGVGTIKLIDFDFVDPAASVRWPLGLMAAGDLKVEALAIFLAQHYPHCAVDRLPMMLGGARQSGPSEGEMLDKVLDGISLIYDATAEPGIQYFLSETAREMRIPYLGVSGTQGGWGGRIVRIRPGITEGCWACVETARLSGEVPEPPADTAQPIQPVGCANPTFTGAGFDMANIAMHGVRLAVSTLTADTENGYPSADWDVEVLAFRSSDGKKIDVDTKMVTLPRHPACPACLERG